MSKPTAKTLQAWQAMTAKDTFTVSEIADQVAMPLEQCRTFINKMVKQGSVLKVGGIGVHTRPFIYQIDPTNNPRVGKGNYSQIKHQATKVQQSIWNTIRIHERVDTALMLQTIPKANLKTINCYLRALELAGYLVRLRADKNINNRQRKFSGRDQLRLKRVFNTGRYAPILRRGVGMWDQNLQKLFPFQVGK
ncbi:hypothetical protein D5018_16450 [Parashewanella curva]|uniref:Uncharacterized protein n=1 Tax=Parashewanella curva TaxID=2338552 RepID=A0A3L8PT60_9GAMM|nr:hypothetical protein [Parashewanella curva]RLV58610.1 hypothetical protein D5018_16450 [Parashewanella curva]